MSFEEDDLEYIMTFPAPLPRDIPVQSRDDDFEFLNGNGEEKEPVVFLLGWLGSLDKHLSKYSAIYNQRGCITVRYTAPAMHSYFQSEKKLVPIAQKLLSLLQDMNLEDHPVFFHAFSNHGSILYYYISQTMSCDPLFNVRLKGCVFDSCPAPRRVTSVVSAVYRVSSGPIWMKLLVSVGFFFYFMGCTVFSFFWSLLSGKLPCKPPWSLVQEENRVPQLFMYSMADRLIRYEDIELFISERRKLKVPVTAQCWLDSDHVQHYRKYPEEYSSVVFSFLKMCLMYNPVDTEGKEKAE